MIYQTPNLIFLLSGKNNVVNGEDLTAVPLEEYSTIYDVPCPKFTPSNMDYLTTSLESINWDDSLGYTFFFVIKPYWTALYGDNINFLGLNAEVEYGGLPCFFPFYYLQIYETGGKAYLAWTAYNWETDNGHLAQVEIDADNWKEGEEYSVVCRIDEDGYVDMWFEGVKATDIVGTPSISKAMEDIFLGCYYGIYDGTELVMFNCDSDVHLTIIQEALPDDVCEIPIGGIMGLYQGIIE